MTFLKAGFDYSCSEASFAVMDEQNNVLIDKILPIGNRNASALPVWLLDSLKEKQIELDSIREWSVGAGPGSFTGLRIASAIVMGLIFRKKDHIRARAVSSAAAAAASAWKQSGKKADRILMMYDGRKSEILTFGTVRKDQSFLDDGTTGVLNVDSNREMPAEGYDAFAVLAKDAPAVRSVLGDAFADRVIVVPHLSATELILHCPGDFSAPLTKLVYLRPAVFVEPKPVRVFA